MNKDSVILEGWLVKSPPEKKTWFRAKWRRRFFVLYEPSAADSLPGTRAALDYFRDETVSKRLGYIDLTHCEEVLSSLDSSLYQHLFALRTKHKGHDRVYYLAVDSEDIMNKWVNSLCCVLGLKENDDDEKPPLSHDRPPPTQTLHVPAQPGPALPDRPRTPLPTPVSALRSSPLPARGGSLSNLPSARSGSYGLSSSMPRTSSPHLNNSPHHGSGSVRQTGALKSSPLSASPASSHQGSRGEGYIPLDECYSDDHAKCRSPLDIVPPAPLDRDSFPSEPAPLPPIKSGQQGAPPRSVDDEMYDYPKRSYININQDNGEYSYPPRRGESSDDGDDGLYKVPPVHRLEFVSQTSSIYKVPPSRHNLSPTSPNNANGWYDVPPVPHSKPRLNSSGTAERRVSDTNNLHEMLSTKVSVEPRTSRWPSGDDTYDVPPTATKSVSENNLLDCVPPPPRSVNRGRKQPTPTNEHTNSRYMNLPSNSKVHPGYVAPPPPVTDSVYDFPRHIQDSDMLEMTPPPPQPCTMVKHRYVNAPPGYVVDPDAEGMYMPMAVQGTDDDLYLPMDSQVAPPRPPRGEDDTLYSYPLSNQPIGPHSVPPSGARGMPPMMLPKQVTILEPGPDSWSDRTENNVISHTRRTKSFKRNIECPYKDEVILPTKKSGQDSQSSSDDETDSVSSHDRSLDNLDTRTAEQALEQQFAQMKSLNSTPPPPTSKRPGEVQYLDLDLNSETMEAEKSPIFPKSLGVRCVTPTDYKEIDFIKTKVLNNMKKDLEKKRKSSEKSVDE